MSPENGAAPHRDYEVDDGGDGSTSIHFAALGIDHPHRPAAERLWWEFREELAADPHLLIPASVPLHAVELAGPRGQFRWSRSSSPVFHRRHMQEVILRGLRVIALFPGVRVRVVYRETNDYARDRPALFAALAHDLNAELAEDATYGRLIVDGDGREAALREAHRTLSPKGRYLTGDPVFEPARTRALLQAADFLAYAAYQAVAKRESRRFMWHWFAETFPDADGPRAR
ncbi:DUF3800 domain-containing protein [Streptomyces sp. NBC_01264]|uniref:DUF3800 domain-containing protein n=1 Tax=Streptomyces sp. NBC_01264 TaxID=2903804 RepID=UPI002257EA67|nr:DUF3800 domain-containing protein [Streptomyces sp. NBC_01264]MCX4783426.1 DUF3800 domain-containing protein [Streptomyces sp. NBC_01264]